MKSVIIYFTGGLKYSVPNSFLLSYAMVQVRFLLYSWLITYYFQVEYVALTMILSFILADFRFFIDFNEYIDSEVQDKDEEDS